MNDPYTDPDTGVLYNLLGATTQDELARREANLTAAGAYGLELEPVRGNYDLDHLSMIHYYLYRDVYQWAGQLRLTDTAKQEHYSRASDIADQSQTLLRNLAAEDHLRGLDRTTFGTRLAAYHTDLHRIHPFREGNTRTQNVFFTQLARDAGYEIRWDYIGPRAHTAATHEAFHGDPRPLQYLYTHMAEPHQAVQRSPRDTVTYLRDRAREAAAILDELDLKGNTLHQALDDGKGRMHQEYTRVRDDLAARAAAVEHARDTETAYTATEIELAHLERQQRQLIASSADAWNSPELKQLDHDIHTLRTQLLDQATTLADATITAGPPALWDHILEHHTHISTHWNDYEQDARITDLNAVAGIGDLGDWFLRHANTLSELATYIQQGTVQPDEIDYPIGAEPRPTPPQPPPHVDPEPPPPTMRP